MKTKLTLTIDEELVPRAKKVARDRGVSLSSIVEDALRDLAGEDEPGFVERWRGAFEPACEDDPRLVALRKKYL